MDKCMGYFRNPGKVAVPAVRTRKGISRKFDTDTRKGFYHIWGKGIHMDVDRKPGIHLRPLLGRRQNQGRQNAG